MAMTNEEMKEALDLTPSQKKAFSQLEKALAECKKQGIKFIGYGDDQYAVNGKRFVSVRDTSNSPIGDNEISMDDIYSYCYPFSCPFIDIETVIKVKPK